VLIITAVVKVQTRYHMFCAFSQYCAGLCNVPCANCWMGASVSRWSSTFQFWAVRTSAAHVSSGDIKHPPSHPPPPKKKWNLTSCHM